MDMRFREIVIIVRDRIVKQDPNVYQAVLTTMYTSVKIADGRIDESSKRGRAIIRRVRRIGSRRLVNFQVHSRSGEILRYRRKWFPRLAECAAERVARVRIEQVGLDGCVGFVRVMGYSTVGEGDRGSAGSCAWPRCAVRERIVRLSRDFPLGSSYVLLGWRDRRGSLGLVRLLLSSLLVILNFENSYRYCRCFSRKRMDTI